MEEKKFIDLKKNELNVKEFVKRNLGKGRISNVKIEYTPIGEKIVVFTNKPGLVIGRRGERVIELTEILKKRFKLENPNVEIQEITKPEFDAQIMADEIALAIERFGSLRFKSIAYKMLQRIIDKGVKGVEIRLSGKLPSERAKSWRFALGFLKKTGDTAKIVDRAKSTAETIAGTVGIKVGILSPYVKIHDQIDIGKELLDEIEKNILNEEIKTKEKEAEEQKIEEEQKKKTRKKVKKRKTKAKTKVKPESKTKGKSEDKAKSKNKEKTEDKVEKQRTG